MKCNHITYVCISLAIIAINMNELAFAYEHRAKIIHYADNTFKKCSRQFLIYDSIFKYLKKHDLERC